jgi:hypothetical protein
VPAFDPESQNQIRVVGWLDQRAVAEQRMIAELQDRIESQVRAVREAVETGGWPAGDDRRVDSAKYHGKIGGEVASAGDGTPLQ